MKTKSLITKLVLSVVCVVTLTLGFILLGVNNANTSNALAKENTGSAIASGNFATTKSMWEEDASTSKNLIPIPTEQIGKYSTDAGADKEKWQSDWNNVMVPAGWGSSWVSGNDDALQVYKPDANDRYTYAIRPVEAGTKGTNACLGGAGSAPNKYAGGVSYTVELSADDMALANAKNLKTNVEAYFFREKGMNYYHAITVEFFNADGLQIGSSNQKKWSAVIFGGSADGYLSRSYTGIDVPAGTQFIRYWFSNNGSGDKRKSVADMEAYLVNTYSHNEHTLTDGVCECGYAEYKLWIGETQVTNENEQDVLSGDSVNAGKVSFIPANDEENATLILSGANITATTENHNIVSNIFGEYDLIIKVLSDNKLTADVDNGRAIFLNGGALTIAKDETRPGSLLLKGQDGPVAVDSGVTYDDDFTLLGASDITDTPTDESVYYSDPSFEMANGVLKTLKLTYETNVHSHCSCGIYDCEQNGAEGHSEITWKKLTQTMLDGLSGGVITQGNYYLTADLSTSSRLTVASGTTVKICLNGYKLTLEDQLFIEETATLTICDCSAEQKGALFDNTYGGTVYNNGTLFVYSGNITSEANDQSLGGKAIYNTGTTTIYDGKITSLYSLAISNSGTLSVRGGVIKGAEKGIGNNKDAKCYLSGSPSIDGGTSSADIEAKSTSVIYAYSIDDSSNKYVGQALSIAFRHENNEVVVVGSADTTLFTSYFAIYSLLVGTGENRGNLVAHTSHNYTEQGYDQTNHWNECSCGATQTATAHEFTNGFCTCSAHKHADSDIIFMPWTAIDSLPTEASNYYLSNDVTISSAWTTPTGETSLCLNGYKVNLNRKYITVESETTLNIYDCNGAKKTNFGEWVGTEYYSIVNDVNDISSPDFDTLTGGIITGGGSGHAVIVWGTLYLNGGNIAGNNGGVSVIGNATGSGGFVMNGGTIIGNDGGNYGGGVDVEAYTVMDDDVMSRGGSFTMNGGSITRNISHDGGGVYVGGQMLFACVDQYIGTGRFVMNGGSITDNSADEGGGVYNNGNFTMSGGSVTDNTANEGGGVYNDDTMTISGSVVIKDNTATCGNNLVTLVNNTISIENGLETGSEIYASVLYYDEDYNPFVTTGKVTSENASDMTAYFKSDSADYIVANGTGNAVTISEKTHNHGGVIYDQTLSGVIDTGDLGSPDKTLDGNYYLTGDHTIVNSDMPFYYVISQDTTVNLCLNGYTFDLGKYNIQNRGTLNICDCSTSKTGKITSAAQGGTIVNEGEVNVNSGTIANVGMEIGVKKQYAVYNQGNLTVGGGKLTSEKEASIYNEGSATATINAGEITSTNSNGITNVDSAVLYVNGGSITGYYQAISQGTLSNTVETCKLYLSGSPTLAYTIDNNGQSISYNNGAIYAQSNDSTPVSYSGLSVSVKVNLNSALEGIVIINDVTTGTSGNKDKFSLVNTTDFNTLILGGADNPQNDLVLHKHSYSTVKYDETNHWNECSCGEKQGVTAHTYNTLKSNSTEHWNECSCGEKQGVSAHTYNTIKSNSTEHWNECSCGVKDGVKAHSWTSTTCSCGLHSHDEGTTIIGELTQQMLGFVCNGGGSITQGTYYLTDNLTATSNLTVASETTVTLCLNGKTLNLGEFTVTNEGTLTVCDCSSGGKVISSKNAIKNGTKSNNSAIFNLNSGTLEGGYAIYNYAIANISGGMVEGATSSSIAIYNAYYTKLVITGGTIESTSANAIYGSGEMFISGGTITSFNNYAIETSDGSVYLSGSPTISGNETGYADIEIGKLYAQSQDGTAKYNGGVISVKMSSPAVNKVAVNNVTNDNKDKFITNDSGYVLVLGTGDNANNLILHSHTYDVVKYDDTNHWKECSCGVKDTSSETTHAIVNADTDCTTDEKCSCGKVMVAKQEEHVYDNACDTTCNNSGCTAGNRETSHLPNEDDGSCLTEIKCSICNEVTTQKQQGHSYVYSANDNVITESCSVEGCSVHTATATISKPTELVYNGNEFKAILTYSDNWAGGQLAISYSRNGDITSAGEVTASIIKDSQTATVTYTIEKAQVTKPTANNTVFTYNGEEQTYSIEANSLYTISNNTRTNAGGQQVTVSLNDTANYEWADETTTDLTFDFVIGKATINAPTISSKVYTGETLTADVNQNDYYTVKTNEGGKNVNSYDVVLELKDANNYKWATRESASLTLTFSITATTNSFMTTPSINGWTYGETASNPIGSAKYGEVVFTYYDSEHNEIAKPTNAGSYYIKASVSADGDNYGSISTDFIAFTVNKATVNAPTISSKVYTGETLTADVNQNDYYTVKTNEGGKNVNSYDVVLELKDANNYKWSSTENATVTLQFNITKATYDMSGVTFNNGTFTYSGNANSIYISGELPTGVSVDYTNNGVTNATTSPVTVTATFTGDSVNYNAIEDMTATITVNKATFDMSGVTFNNKTVIYNGEPHSILINGSLPTGVTVEYNNNAKTQVGSYTVIANFIYDSVNYNEIPSRQATLTIHQDMLVGKVEGNDSQPNVIVTNAGGFQINVTIEVTVRPIISSGSFLQPEEKVANVFDITMKDNGVVVQPNGDIEIKLLIPSNLLSKDFRLIHNHENDFLPVEYTIDQGYAIFTVNKLSDFLFVTEKETATISGVANTKVYDASAVSSLGYTYSGDGEITVTWFADNNGEKGEALASAPINAGTYWVEVSAPETDDYKAVSQLVKFTITKATIDISGITFTDDTVIYDGEAHSLAISGTLPNGVTVEYENNGKTQVGEYEVTAKFIIQDTANYNAIAPIKATLTIEAPIIPDDGDDTPGQNPDDGDDTPGQNPDDGDDTPGQNPDDQPSANPPANDDNSSQTPTTDSEKPDLTWLIWVAIAIAVIIIGGGTALYVRNKRLVKKNQETNDNGDDSIDNE